MSSAGATGRGARVAGTVGARAHAGAAAGPVAGGAAGAVRGRRGVPAAGRRRPESRRGSDHRPPREQRCVRGAHARDRPTPPGAARRRTPTSRAMGRMPRRRMTLNRAPRAPPPRSPPGPPGSTRPLPRPRATPTATPTRARVRRREPRPPRPASPCGVPALAAVRVDDHGLPGDLAGHRDRRGDLSGIAAVHPDGHDLRCVRHHRERLRQRLPGPGARPRMTEYDSHAGTVSPSSARDQRLGLDGIRDRLQRQHVRARGGQHLQPRPVPRGQLADRQPVAPAVLRPVGQRRAVRPDRGGDPARGGRRRSPDRAEPASATLRRSSRAVSSGPIPQAANPVNDAWYDGRGRHVRARPEERPMRRDDRVRVVGQQARRPQRPGEIVPARLELMWPTRRPARAGRVRRGTSSGLLGLRSAGHQQRHAPVRAAARRGSSTGRPPSPPGCRRTCPSPRCPGRGAPSGRCRRWARSRS